MKKWYPIQCFRCHGTGQVSSYTFSGEDFLGAKECDECGGSGGVYISPNKKAIAQYPGGPFRGQPSEEDLKLVKE